MWNSSGGLEGKGERGVNRRLKINFHIGQVVMGTYGRLGSLSIMESFVHDRRANE